jgi:hypothetical protein
MKRYGISQFFFYKLVEALHKDKVNAKTALIVGGEYDIKVTIERIERKKTSPEPAEPIVWFDEYDKLTSNLINF